MPESEPFYGGPHFVRHDFEGTSRDLRFTRYSHLARHMHLDRVKTGEEIGSLFLLYLFPPFRPLFPRPQNSFCCPIPLRRERASEENRNSLRARSRFISVAMTMSNRKIPEKSASSPTDRDRDRQSVSLMI